MYPKSSTKMIIPVPFQFIPPAISTGLPVSALLSPSRKEPVGLLLIHFVSYALFSSGDSLFI